MHIDIMDDLRVKVVVDWEEFLALEAEWEGLAAAMQYPMPFLTHAWVRLWWSTFNGGNYLHIITVWDGNRLAGVLPLQKTTCRVLRIFRLPCLHSLTNGHSVAFNLICRPAELEPVLGAIKQYLINNSHIWSVVILGYVPEDGATIQGFKHILDGDGRIVFIEPKDGAYYINIDGRFEDYYGFLNKSFRDTRKNIDNRISKLGGVVFEVYKVYDSEVLKQFYDLENSGWKRERGSSIGASVSLMNFYNEVALAFADRKQFLLAIIRLGGEPVAAVFGLLSQGNFFFLKLGANYCDPRYEKLSPGQVILHNLIKYCFENGMKRFDFYGPCYAYEAHWTKAVNRRYTLMIFNRHSAVANICAVLKQWFLLWKKFACR